MTGASDARVTQGSVEYALLRIRQNKRECLSHVRLTIADAEALANATAPLLAALEQAERSIEMLRSYGCGRCNGDCGSANPHVLSCPMQVARKALATITAALAKHKGAGDGQAHHAEHTADSAGKGE